MSTYEVVDEDNIPLELKKAVKNGDTVECKTCGMWIALDSPDFKCGVTYRVRPEDS